MRGRLWVFGNRVPLTILIKGSSAIVYTADAVGREDS